MQRDASAKFFKILVSMGIALLGLNNAIPMLAIRANNIK